MSGYFNDDQEDWITYLASLPRETKCACGWNLRGECFNCNKENNEAQSIHHQMSEELTARQVCEQLNEMKWRGREDWELIEYPHAVYWATWPVQDDGYNPYPEGISESCESARAIVEGARAKAEVKHLKESVEFWRKQTECPICYGVPPVSGLPCICGGSNSTQNAIRGVMIELCTAERESYAAKRLAADVEVEVERLRDAIGEGKTRLRTADRLDDDSEVTTIILGSGPRIQTGPIRFIYGEERDWTGLFLRGDDAFAVARDVDWIESDWTESLIPGNSLPSASIRVLIQLASLRKMIDEQVDERRRNEIK